MILVWGRYDNIAPKIILRFNFRLHLSFAEFYLYKKENRIISFQLIYRICGRLFLVIFIFKVTQISILKNL